MPEINVEDRRYFENKIYLPILITVLERDLEVILRSPFKLQRPYLAIVENALKRIRSDLKITDIYMLRRDMRLVANKVGEGMTEYTYISKGIEDLIRYSSDHLRNESERILSTYIASHTPLD